MNVQRIAASRVLPLVHAIAGKAVEVEKGVACLPIGKSERDDSAWVTGRYRQIERDIRNNCWLVELEPTP